MPDLAQKIRDVSFFILSHCGGFKVGYQDGFNEARRDGSSRHSGAELNSLCKERAEARFMEGSLFDYQLECYMKGFKDGYEAYFESMKKQALLAQLPVSFVSVTPTELDREICRAGMIAELDAVSFYEQMAAATKNEALKKVLLDVAQEEETHIGEFQTILKGLDTSYSQELQEGEQEVEELTGDEFMTPETVESFAKREAQPKTPHDMGYWYGEMAAESFWENIEEAIASDVLDHGERKVREVIRQRERQGEHPYYNYEKVEQKFEEALPSYEEDAITAGHVVPENIGEFRKGFEEGFFSQFDV